MQPALKQLTDQQVRFAPPAKREEQLGRVEKLLVEIEPEKKYPYQYICFRITEFRPDSYPDLLIDGGDLKHDLKRMIQALGGRIWTLAEVSRELNVSTKTVRRWKARGLVGLPMISNGRRQLGYPQLVIDDFLTNNKEHVERGGRFSQLSDEEKDNILRRARRLSRVAGGSLTEVSRRIARRLGRSVETVRYTIKNFDREYPEQALFPNLTGPLEGPVKHVIYNAYRRGIAVDTLAKRFNRTRTSVYRVINEVRAQRLLEQPLDYIYHESFDDPAVEAAYTAAMPGVEEYEAKRREMKAPKDVPPELAPMYEVPLLNKDQKQHLSAR